MSPSMADPVPEIPPGALRALVRILCKWILLPLCLLITAGLGSLTLICLYKPELVAASVRYHLNAATGMPWRIRGSIRPEIAPYPGFSVSEVLLLAASPEQAFLADPSRPLVRIKTLRLSLDPAALLRFSLRFHRIELDEPEINLTYDAWERPLWLAPPQPGAQGQRDAPAREEDGEPSDALRNAADLVGSLPPFAAQPVRIRNGSFRSWDRSGNLLLSFSGLEGRFLPGEREENLFLSAGFAVPAAGLDLSARLTAQVGRNGVPARGSFSGRVNMTPPGSRTLSGDFAGSFTWLPSGRDLVLPDFRLLAESDFLTANLVADLAAPACTGTVQIHRLSLPRWFEFGRVLPPGLRQALDSLVGDFSLQLDRNRAEARNLRVLAGPLAVSGYVGTPDFSHPVVVVDVDGDRADLDRVLPFLAPPGVLAPDPAPPVFDHPPLAPYPEAPGPPPPLPDAAPDIAVGYDVTVRFARPRVHAVDGGPLEVTVRPARVADGEKTRVAFSASSLLKGNVDGRLDIDGRSILMRYEAKGLELGLLPENAPAVRVAGKSSGLCEIDVPLLQSGDLADDWNIRVDAVVDAFEIGVHSPTGPWNLTSSRLAVKGSGGIHAVPAEGIRIAGQWDLEGKGMGTSWSPGEKDAVSAGFNGGLFWPPLGASSGQEAQKRDPAEQRSLARVAGAVTGNGTLAVPLGSFRAPLTGRLSTTLDWRLHEETLALDDIRFEGFDSQVEGQVRVVLSGPGAGFVSDAQGSINAASLLKGWGVTLPEGMRPPRLFKGKTGIAGNSRSLRFDKIRIEMDGAPISGDIARQESTDGGKGSDSALWTVRLSADHPDFDALFPPDPPDAPSPLPSKTPWNLTPLKDLGIDAQISLSNMKKDRLTFSGTKVTATLQQDRFSLHAAFANFYNGSGDLFFQGTVAPEKSLVNLRKGLAQMQGVSLGKMLEDYADEHSYAGTADLVVDLTGHLSANADIPAKLSGVWNLTIRDGQYPAFLTAEDSSLRNIFSSAVVGGVLDKGVLRSDNFKLTGPMVDMAGGGWLDLNAKTCDIAVSATLAKVPTVPVRFYGSTRAPRMQVRGVDMVVETVQHAGLTVFGLVRGVLMLPAYAAKGIGALFDSDETKEKNPPRTAPVRVQTGRPGQGTEKPPR